MRDSDDEDVPLSLLPKAARMVETQKIGEQREYRRSMRDWQNAFQSQQIDRSNAQNGAQPPGAKTPLVRRLAETDLVEAPKTAVPDERFESHRQEEVGRSAAEQPAVNAAGKRRSPESPTTAAQGQRGGKTKRKSEQSTAPSKRKIARASEAASDSLLQLAGSAASATVPPLRQIQPSVADTRPAEQPAAGARQTSKDGACRGPNDNLLNALLSATEAMDGGSKDSLSRGPDKQQGSRLSQPEPRATAYEDVREKSSSGLTCSESALATEAPNAGVGDIDLKQKKVGRHLLAAKSDSMTFSKGFSSNQAAALQALMDADAEAARLLDEL